MPHVNETLATLNLSANPFAAETPMESLFPGAERRGTLEKLQHLCRYSDDIVALIGPDGSGKSTLGDFFARQAAKDQIVARARASLLTSPTQLLEEMFKAFVLDFPAQGSIVELKSALQNYFMAVQQQERSVVLIVDDAHELGDDALSLLIRLALTENTNGAFHLLLLGESQLHDMLDYTCPLKNGASQFTCLQLPPLTLDETRNYLSYRLNSVGCNQDDEAQPFPFSKKQIERIDRLAEGNPGRINRQAQSMLESPQGIMAQLSLAVSASIPRSFPRTFPRNYAIAAAALVTVLLIAFISGSGDDEEVARAQRTVSLPIPLPNAAETTPTSALADASDGAPVDRVDNALDANANANAVTSIVRAPAPSVATSSDVASTADTVSVPGNASATEPAPTSSTSASASTATATPRPAQSTSISTAVARPAAASSVAATPAAPSGNASAPANNQAAQRSRILALPATQFTLQLMGASSRTNVEDFVRRQANSAIYWYETRSNDRPWFVIIHGAYASRGDAQSAVAGLPGELGKLEPWIRPLSTVQAEVRAQN